MILNGLVFSVDKIKKKDNKEEIDKQKKIDFYLSQLKSKDFKVQMEGAKALKTLNNYNVIEPLIEFLDKLYVRKQPSGISGQTNSQRLLYHIRRAILSVSDMKGTEIFYKNLSHRKSLIKCLSIGVLSRIKYKKLIDRLVYFIKESKNEMVRSSSLNALTKYEDPRIPEALIFALKDKSSNVKRRAIEAIIHYGFKKVPNSSELIRKLIFDSNIKVKNTALHYLVQINDPKNIQLLINIMLYHKDVSNRSTLIRYFGKIKEHRAILPLIKYLRKAESTYEIRSILGSLRKLTKKDFGNDSVKWKKWYKKNRKRLNQKRR